MVMITVARGIRPGFRRLTLALVLLTVATPMLAQDADARPLRIVAISGGLLHGSAVVVDPASTSDTRLSAGPTFGLELQYKLFSSGSFYAGAAGSFSTLEHGTNLGAVAGPGSSGATVILGTAGVVLEASDWFASFQPTLRLGGGLKAYSLSTNGASSFATFTGDVGLGMRASSGAVGVSAEIRYLPSAFDQGKLPLRGLTPQDQQQNDLLFTIGVTVKP